MPQFDALYADWTQVHGELLRAEERLRSIALDPGAAAADLTEAREAVAKLREESHAKLCGFLQATHAESDRIRHDSGSIDMALRFAKARLG